MPTRASLYQNPAAVLRRLAADLAELARELKRKVLGGLVDGTGDRILRLQEGFRRTYGSDRSDQDFADWYAQTAVCGLAAAACEGPGTSGGRAAELVTDPFLAESFRSWPGEERAAVAERFQRARGCAPASGLVFLLSCYDRFLQEYDPDTRRRHGVFATPAVLARFMVRSIDVFLREDFGLRDGLADTSTETAVGNMLDPAAGTGVFLVEAIDQVQRVLASRWHEEGLSSEESARHWQAYVPRWLLPRLRAFEILPAAHALAHLAVGWKLAATGYQIQPGDRVLIQHGNALEELAGQSNGVNLGLPIVLGNPPYAITSANRVQSACRLVDRYRSVRGVPIRERGALKAEVILQDDYVKFLALAQQLVEQASRGIVCLLTNAAFYRNPTLRGLRAALLESFDRLYLLDLGGQARSRSRDDENLFRIAVGVGLTLLGHTGGTDRVVRVGRLQGRREEKQSCLSRAVVQTLAVGEATPRADLYLFKANGTSEDAGYARWPGIHEVFTLSSLGIKTARDHLVLDPDRQSLEARLTRLLDPGASAQDLALALRLRDNTQWQFSRARTQFCSSYDPAHYTLVDYRPFDTRWLYYHRSLVFNPRPTVNRHVLGKQNLCLLTTRRIRTERHAHFFVSRRPALAELLSATDNCHVFPLYSHGPDGCRRANLHPEVPASFQQRLGLAYRPEGSGDLVQDFGPDDVFHYFYAVCHSPAYRQRFAENLRDDFPRLPFPGQAAVFRTLAGCGAALVAQHLLEGQDRAGSWHRAGGSCIEPGYPRFDEDRILLNSHCWFEGVAPDVWAFCIGSHQVAARWLKDRRGRLLPDEEADQFRRILATIGETLRLMNAIDEEIARQGGWPAAFWGGGISD